MARSLFLVCLFLPSLACSLSASEPSCALAGQISAAAPSEPSQSTASAQPTPAVATGSHIAHVAVSLPDPPVADRHAATVELVVRPDVLSPKELFVVMVYATEIDGPAGCQNDEFLGGFTWHMPPVEGEPNTFYVNAPVSFRRAESNPDSLDIDVRLAPVDPDVLLQNSRLTILQATLVP